MVHSEKGKTTATAESMVAALGPASPTFRHAFHVLGRLYREVKDEPDVQVRFQEWRSYLSIVYGEPVGDEELFVVHTYLATLARLIAFYLVQPSVFLPGKEDHIKVINGEYFRERDIYNFVEEDFFTWILNSKVLGDSLELVRCLVNTLTGYNFASAGQDLLKGLYQELVDPQARHDLGEYYTLDWLAEHILSGELKLQDNPDLSVLDPACGSGTFLVTAIHLIRDGMARRGEDESDTLLHILNSVMGVDVHPVAVTIARTNYLLALGDLISGPHPPVLVPVYLADAIQLPEVSRPEPQKAGESPAGPDHSEPYGEPVHIVSTVDPKVSFELPDSVVDDPVQLDWLLHRLAQYLHAAKFRAGREGEEHATEEVINSLYAYLTSPKRAGLRQLPPLSPFAAEVLCRTSRTLMRFASEGAGNFWLHLLKNSPAPVHLSRRKFDLVVGKPPWHPTGDIQNRGYYRCLKQQDAEEDSLIEPSPHPPATAGPVEAAQMGEELLDPAAFFFLRSAELYLRDSGTIAFVLPRSVLNEAQQGGSAVFSFKGGSRSAGSGQALVLGLENVLDLDRVEPPAGVPVCVLVARMVEWA